MPLLNVQHRFMAQRMHYPVEIVYATPTKQWVVQVMASSGDCIKTVIEASGLLQQCPEIDLTRNVVGIFSERRALTDEVKPGDSIEIYRPLTIDPKQARLLRATKVRYKGRA